MYVCIHACICTCIYVQTYVRTGVCTRYIIISIICLIFRITFTCNNVFTSPCTSIHPACMHLKLFPITQTHTNQFLTSCKMSSSLSFHVCMLSRALVARKRPPHHLHMHTYCFDFIPRARSETHDKLKPVSPSGPCQVETRCALFFCLL